MKKLFSMILALTMILGLSSFVMADATTPTITVKNVTADTDLDLYQILKYTYNTQDNYSKVEFVNTPEGTAALYEEAFTGAITDARTANPLLPALKTGYSVNDIMLWITNNIMDTTAQNAFAESLAGKLEKVVNDNAIVATYTEESPEAAYAENALTFTGVNMGYYLILDVTPAVDGTSYNSIVMLQPLSPDVTVVLKSSTYTPPTKVVDGDQEKDGVSVGDQPKFTVTATVPSPSGDATGFTYIIKDTLPAGLSFVSLDSFTINGVDATAGVDYTKVADLHYTFTNDTLVPANNQVNPGDVIVIEYTTRVNADAEYDNLTNSVKDYLNDPDTHITEKKVPLHTYGIEVKKVNEIGETLDGVTFKVFKLAEDGETRIYLKFTATGIYDGEATDIGAATLLRTADGGKITLKGLAQGDYYLDEIETLDGYNKLAAPWKVVIDGVALNDEQVEVVAPFENVDVINTSGIELPGTGGMGTAMFTILGTIIMAGAAFVLVINRKRIFNV